MTDQHTPGPWHVTEAGHARLIKDASGEFVASAGAIVADYDGRALPQVDPNARLIAAAPAMLEALREAIDFARSTGNGNWNVDDLTRMSRWMDIIAAATGEEVSA